MVRTPHRARIGEVSPARVDRRRSFLTRSATNLGHAFPQVLQRTFVHTGFDRVPTAPIRMRAREEYPCVVRTSHLRRKSKELLAQSFHRARAVPLDDMETKSGSRSHQTGLGPGGRSPGRRAQPLIRRIHPDPSFSPEML
jgi:hypothetical protein